MCYNDKQRYSKIKNTHKRNKDSGDFGNLCNSAKYTQAENNCKNTSNYHRSR